MIMSHFLMEVFLLFYFLSMSAVASPTLILIFLSTVLCILLLPWPYLHPPPQELVPNTAYTAQKWSPNFLVKFSLLLHPMMISPFFEFLTLELDGTLNNFLCNCFTFVYIPVQNNTKLSEVRDSFIQGHCISCEYLSRQIEIVVLRILITPLYVHLK